MGSHDHHDVRPELARGGLRNAASSLDPERTLAAYDGAEIVGGASIYGRFGYGIASHVAEIQGTRGS